MSYTEEHQNFFRFSSLLLDIGAEVLREVLASYYSPDSFQNFLAKPNVSLTIDDLFDHEVLKETQYDLLYPPWHPPMTLPSVHLDSLDITLLFTLIRNFNPTKDARKKVWSFPQPTDNSIEADAVRVKETRNTLFAHAKSNRMDLATFNIETTKLETLYVGIIQKLPSPRISQKELKDKMGRVLSDSIELDKQQTLLRRLDVWYSVDIPIELQQTRVEVAGLGEQAAQTRQDVSKLGEQITQTFNILTERHERFSEILSDVAKLQKDVLDKSASNKLLAPASTKTSRSLNRSLVQQRMSSFSGAIYSIINKKAVTKRDVAVLCIAVGGMLVLTFFSSGDVDIKLEDCHEILTSNSSAESGVYKIYPTNSSSHSLTGLDVYCDMTTQDGGWIVFQRRKDGKENFNRKWIDYKNGFGDLRSDFWLGLDAIHALTSSGKWELLINMEDNEKGKKNVQYRSFNVGSESGEYVLTVGNYTGDDKDGLVYHNGMMFTTRDRDNDHAIKYNCAGGSVGGWWHNACYVSHLNNKFGSVRWAGFSLTVEFAEMKIRKVFN